jgi:ribonuclease HI
MAYIIYTDGSCLKNPGGPGGYAAVLYHGEILHLELSGGESSTTSNRMEIMAAITGLQAVQQPSIITLCSDSQYVIKTMTRGWKRLKNVDLWTRLDAVAEPHRITWKWIRGHRGIAGNERADELANIAARLLA